MPANIPLPVLGIKKASHIMKAFAINANTTVTSANNACAKYVISIYCLSAKALTINTIPLLSQRGLPLGDPDAEENYNSK